MAKPLPSLVTVRNSSSAKCPGGVESPVARVSIPRLAHFVWLGGALPGSAIHNMLRFAEQHPTWQATLWTDKARTEEIRATGLVGAQSRISLRLVDELEATASKEAVSAAFRESVGPLANYQAASDIFRTMIILQHGGVYMDVDVKLQKPFPAEGLSLTGGVETRRCSNAIIAASPNNPRVRAILEKMATKYSPRRLPGEAEEAYAARLHETWSYKRDFLANDLKEYQGLLDAVKRAPASKRDEAWDAARDFMAVVRERTNGVWIDRPRSMPRAGKTIAITGPAAWRSAGSGNNELAPYADKHGGDVTSYTTPPARLRRASL